MGLMVHGSWWEGKFQYWLAALNSPVRTTPRSPASKNRSDDNDEKDVALKLMLRPIWQKGKWGSLEFGYSRQDGIHGEGGNGYYNPPVLPFGLVPLTNFPLLLLMAFPWNRRALTATGLGFGIAQVARSRVGGCAANTAISKIVRCPAPVSS